MKNLATTSPYLGVINAGFPHISILLTDQVISCWKWLNCCFMINNYSVSILFCRKSVNEHENVKCINNREVRKLSRIATYVFSHFVDKLRFCLSYRLNLSSWKKMFSFSFPLSLSFLALLPNSFRQMPNPDLFILILFFFLFLFSINGLITQVWGNLRETHAYTQLTSAYLISAQQDLILNHF